jgi:alkylated DNA nucleotide flippase Atl1
MSSKSTREQPKVTWQQLVVLLAQAVPAGAVTTYAEVSDWAYGRRNLNQPVSALLRGAASHGFTELTNRVVGADGKLASLPGGAAQQEVQLRTEGVPFMGPGQVNMIRATVVQVSLETPMRV